ncbi:bpX6 domain-containing protein [Kitasatospora sp. NBC_00085]|uniref:bpX6 domain-containing protein n=1 Tax=Kitasatospora sp. NBC_00085 TaxID=2903566 RepID=UPI0032534E80
MTATPAAAFRATVTAAGYLLDVPVIGAAEAAARVLTRWQDGAVLRELPDGRWLFTLAAAVEVRADRAPGLPVERAESGALVAVGTDRREMRAGRLAFIAAGLTITHDISELPELDPSGWLDPTGVALHRPRPVGGAAEPVAEPVEEAVPQRPQPDLRPAAGIRPSSARARRLTGDAPAGARRRSFVRPGPGTLAAKVGPAAYWLALVLTLGAMLMAAASFVGIVADRSFRPGGFLIVLAVGLAAARRRVGATETTAAAGAASPAAPAPGRPRSARRPRLGGLLARLAMRTPAARLVRGRHARYLHELTRAFEQRRWEDALRDAVPVAGAKPAGGKSWLSLGLPRRYTGELRATPKAAGAGGASPLSGPTVHEHLAGLYRHAAEALEREGRVDEAAFVLADLLNAPAEAVAVLIRNGRTAQAAELAEGRDLAADLVVRLWWRAGEREHAVRIAHRRGAFATAVERLTATYPQAARELRAAWAAHCREAGDRLGTVEAAWPDEALRPTIAADLRDAVALGGPARGRALPYLLALGAGEATRALALAVLDGDGDPRATGRSALAAALADLPAADPAADRELATAAARAVVRDGGFGGVHARKAESALAERLLKRADPLAAADLARPRQPARPAGAAPAYTAAEWPGTLPVLDAALLGSGALLVACGQAGVRLLTADGRTKARWDVPADHLVLADHGGSALLVAGYGRVREIARLDLVTRAARPWTTLRVRQIAPSFDGRHLITEDEDGIAVLDTLAPRPTVVWRELGDGQRLVGRIARTAGSCAAVVVSALPDGSPLTELWRWDLPGWELRSRLRLDEATTAPDVSVALASEGLLTAHVQEHPDRTTLVRTDESAGPATEMTVAGLAPYGPTVDGDHWALTVPLADGTGALVHLGAAPAAEPTATAVFPHADPPYAGLRGHAGAVTHWHRSGRVLATSADGATLLANLRVTAE